MSDRLKRSPDNRKRSHDQGKTVYATTQHDKKEAAERLGKSADALEVPDRAKRVGHYTDDPHYYTTASETSSIQKTPLHQERFDTDTFITDYDKDDIITDMSKAPLFFGKPGQFETVTTWCEIHFMTNDELSQNKQKQAAHFASLFRGQVLTWLARQDNKNTLLLSYPKLKEAVAKDWEKTEAVKQADAARRISTIYQRKSVQQYKLEFDGYADTLKWTDSAKAATFKRGLKQHVREALISSITGTESYDELAEEAERIDAELFSLRRAPRGNFGQRGGRSGFKGKCNACGQFGHKAANCRKQGKDAAW